MKTAEEIIHKIYMDKYNDTKEGCNYPMYYPNYAIQAMEEYADQFKPKWISIDDRPPNDKQHFDGYHPELGRITNLVFRDGQFIQDADCKANAPCWRKMQTLWIDITHWMPLPEKPEE